jgi:TfoX/Sxy family transcriptional regulator of competence genes
MNDKEKDKEIEKREKKKKYLKNYYEKNKKLWRDGEKYHKTYKKTAPLIIERGKVCVRFD